MLKSLILSSLLMIGFSSSVNAQQQFNGISQVRAATGTLLRNDLLTRSISAVADTAYGLRNVKLVPNASKLIAAGRSLCFSPGTGAAISAGACGFVGGFSLVLGVGHFGFPEEFQENTFDGDCSYVFNTANSSCMNSSKTNGVSNVVVYKNISIKFDSSTTCSRNFSSMRGGAPLGTQSTAAVLFPGHVLDYSGSSTQGTRLNTNYAAQCNGQYLNASGSLSIGSSPANDAFIAAFDARDYTALVAQHDEIRKSYVPDILSGISLQNGDLSPDFQSGGSFDQVDVYEPLQPASEADVQGNVSITASDGSTISVPRALGAPGFNYQTKQYDGSTGESQGIYDTPISVSPAPDAGSGTDNPPAYVPDYTYGTRSMTGISNTVTTAEGSTTTIDMEMPNRIGVDILTIAGSDTAEPDDLASDDTGLFKALPSFNFGTGWLPRTCPAPMQITILGKGHSFSFEPLCTYAEYIHYLVLVSSLFSAAAIVFGGSRK